MIFGGIQKSSLIDFPGKVACVLFLSGCNFRCPYCHNPELVLGKPAAVPSLEEDAVFAMLETRRGFLDGVVISGGEPTLDPGLPTLCKTIRGMGFSVKLDTNGSRPYVLSRLMEDGLIDYVAMDLKTVPDQYAPHFWKNGRPADILKSIQLILTAGFPTNSRPLAWRQSLPLNQWCGCRKPLRALSCMPCSDAGRNGCWSRNFSAGTGAANWMIQRLKP